jgi:hypothetical protein
VPQVDAAGHLKSPQLKDVLCGTDPSVDLMESTGSLELGELSVPAGFLNLATHCRLPGNGPPRRFRGGVIGLVLTAERRQGSRRRESLECSPQDQLPSR